MVTLPLAVYLAYLLRLEGLDFAQYGRGLVLFTCLVLIATLVAFRATGCTRATGATPPWRRCCCWRVTC